MFPLSIPYAGISLLSSDSPPSTREDYAFTFLSMLDSGLYAFRCTARWQENNLLPSAVVGIDSTRFFAEGCTVFAPKSDIFVLPAEILFFP